MKKYRGYEIKRQNRKDGLPLIIPALQRTASNVKDAKKQIDKWGFGDKEIKLIKRRK